MCFTLLCLANRKKVLANSVDPDDDAASHLDLRCLLKGISLRNILNIEINILDISNYGNKLIKFRRMGESSRHKWVKKNTLHYKAAENCENLKYKHSETSTSLAGGYS